MKNKLALVIAIVLGLIAVFGVNQYIGTREKEFKTKNPSVYVAAAADRIKAGEPIRMTMLYSEKRGDQVVQGIEMPETAVTKDHILVGEQAGLIGQTINRTVERGEPLLASYFRKPAERLEQRLEYGERAMTLRVDAITGVAGNVVPGSQVDIVGTFPMTATPGRAAPGTPGSGSGSTQTMLLLANVKVLATDSRLREEEFVTVTGQRARNYSSVTVAVTPAEANMLVYSQQLGTLTLTLRSPADNIPSAGPQEITEQNLLDNVKRAQGEREQRLKGRSSPIEVVPTRQ